MRKHSNEWFVDLGLVTKHVLKSIWNTHYIYQFMMGNNYSNVCNACDSNFTRKELLEAIKCTESRKNVLIVELSFHKMFT